MTQFTCNLCALSPKANGERFVLGNGNVKAEIVIIAEAPSQADARTGIPMSSHDERALNGDVDLLVSLCKEAGIPGQAIFRTTLVKCRPPVDKYGNLANVKPEEIVACHGHLDRELSYIKPKIIITMGSATSERILGNKSVASGQDRVFDSAQALGFTWALSGEKKTLTRKKVKSEVALNSPNVFKVVPTYSLAMIRRNPSYLEPIRRAFIMAGKLLRGESLVTETKLVHHLGYTEPDVYRLLGDVWDLTKTEKRLFFDIETSGLNWYPLRSHPHVAKTLTCAFGFKEFETFGVVLRDQIRSPRIMKLYKDILESDIPKAGHNGKFDNLFCRGELGIRVKNYGFDTMLAAWQLDQGTKVDLGTLSLLHRPDLGRYWEEVYKYMDKRTGYLKAPDEILLPYNCKDVDASVTLYNVYEPELVAQGRTDCFYQITMPHQAEAEEMEFYGAPIDVEATENLGRRKLHELDQVKAKLFELTGKHPEGLKPAQLAERGIKPEDYKPFNPGSSQQIGKILYEELKLPVMKWTNNEKTTPSTDADALEMLKGKAPFLDALLEYRGLQKQLSTTIGWERRDDGTEGVISDAGSGAFLAVVDVNGRIHTSINIHGTATGRTSSSDPNLQNVPKTAEFRSLFKAPKGWRFGDSDYASLELRILAFNSGDPALLKAFKEGIDLHSSTGAGIFGLTLDMFEGVEYWPDPQNPKVFELFDAVKAPDKGPVPGKTYLMTAHPEARKDQIFVRKSRKERKVGKIMNFAVIYGKGAASLVTDLAAEGIDSTKAEAQEYLDGWGRTYSQAWAWMERKWAELEKTGEVRYSMGRRRKLPTIFSNRRSDQNEARRQCINTPVQGTGADCTSMSLISIGRRLRQEIGADKARLILEIHDQVIVEFLPEYSKQVEQIVVEEMERPKPFLNQELGLDLAAEYEEVADLGASVN